MFRIQYVHWNEQETEQRAVRIREMGFLVDCEPASEPGFRTAFRKDPPDAVVIDLSRLPSHGREVALWLTSTKSTRQIPVIFVGGAIDKIKATRQKLPDAAYTDWPQLATDIVSAIHRSQASRDPRIRRPSYSICSVTPLVGKLGIKPGLRIAIVNAPDGFVELLGSLPDGTSIQTTLRGKPDLVIWFPKNAKDLENRIDELAIKTPAGGIWIAWKKQQKGINSNISQSMIRELALASSLVDYKICSIDETWSGLKFAHASQKE